MRSWGISNWNCSNNKFLRYSFTQPRKLFFVDNGCMLLFICLSIPDRYFFVMKISYGNKIVIKPDNFLLVYIDLVYVDLDNSNKCSLSLVASTSHCSWESKHVAPSSHHSWSFIKIDLDNYRKCTYPVFQVPATWDSDHVARSSHRSWSSLNIVDVDTWRLKKSVLYPKWQLSATVVEIASVWHFAATVAKVPTMWHFTATVVEVP